MDWHYVHFELVALVTLADLWKKSRPGWYIQRGADHEETDVYARGVRAMVRNEDERAQALSWLPTL